MTMRVVLKNEDPHRTAIVREETFEIGEERNRPPHITNTILGPGEERAVYIHAAKRVIVQEVAEATAPAPKAGPTGRCTPSERGRARGGSRAGDSPGTTSKSAVRAVEGYLAARTTLEEALGQLAQAIKRASADHGRPNSFSPMELQLYGGPDRKLSGRVGRRFMVALWRALGGHEQWGSCPVYRDRRFFV